MARLEDLKRGATVKGILPDQVATVVDVKWFGSSVIELTYKDASGRPGIELIYRDREPTLEVITTGRPWSFDGNGEMFRLVSEAYRIRLAYLFDPLLAVHTSLVDPLPHQITAVYGEMLTRQPLRYLLADDPGAGKTIMTGLFLKELLVRADLKRCLICCPGNLTEQWQDELYQRFHLPFEIMTREMMETARSGNAFTEHNLIICRLDQLSRNEDIQAKLAITDWDMIVCDEAHKMSASFFRGEVKATKRYRLGQLLGRITRHFLLLTATPHNGKEEDFQLFMALLDADRFEGRFRDGVHVVDTSDLMRRMVKEQLVKFDRTPLFPERFAYTVKYKLSDLEARLYKEVTDYVRDEMNRAERLAAEGEGRRGNMVGFALTVLQRRLASSPEAIYQSLKRRRERLEKRLREEEILKRGAFLIDPNNRTEEARALFYLEHSIQDARSDRSGGRRVVSRQMQFVEIDGEGRVNDAGYAPYLDYRPATEEEREALAAALEAEWLSADLESRVMAFAVEQLVPKHLQDVKKRKEELVQKTMAAVKDRLTKEITYWDHRAEELKAQEQAGSLEPSRRMARINSSLARQRADDLEARLRARMEELEQERHLSPLPPVVIGGALVVPQALLNRVLRQAPEDEQVSQADRERIDQIAMAAVLETERRLNRNPRPMPHENPGYDIESEDPANKRLYFIEVKGKAAGQQTVTVSKTQILTALNKPDDFILALVQVDGDRATNLRYVRRPFQREPDFGVVSVNYDLAELLARGQAPT